MTYRPASCAAAVGEGHQGASNGGEHANRVKSCLEPSPGFWESAELRQCIQHCYALSLSRRYNKAKGAASQPRSNK